MRDPHALRKISMSQTGIIQVDKVTKDEFIELVAEYPSLVEAISNSKDGTSGLRRRFPYMSPSPSPIFFICASSAMQCH